MLDMFYVKYSRYRKTFHSQHLINARHLLCIGSQCHNIVQSNTVKVLLRHLKRHYVVIRINNCADSTNGMCFLFDKFPYLLKPLISFSIEGACPNKPFGQAFCANTIVVRISSKLYGTIGWAIHPTLGSQTKPSIWIEQQQLLPFFSFSFLNSNHYNKLIDKKIQSFFLFFIINTQK